MGYLVAGYLVAAVGLGGYALSLVVRARRATARAAAIATRRLDDAARGRGPLPVSRADPRADG